MLHLLTGWVNLLFLLRVALDFCCVLLFSGGSVSQSNAQRKRNPKQTNTMSLHNPSLESQLHELFMEGGEIAPPRTIADLVLQFESFHGVHCTDAEVLVATRNAGESFVESMIQNEYDTEEEGYTDLAPIEQRVEHWESMRPSTIRRKHLETLAAQA